MHRALVGIAEVAGLENDGLKMTTRTRGDVHTAHDEVNAN